MTRREFIASTTLIFVAPTIALLPSQQTPPAKSQSRAIFMIHGWGVQDDPAGAHHVGMTVSNSWRTAWR